MWQGKGQGSPGGVTDATQAARICLEWMVWTCFMRWPCWVPCLVPALGTGAEAPVGTTPQRCLARSSQVLARVQGQRCLLP